MIYDGLLSGAQQCVFHVIVIGRKNIKIILKRVFLLYFFLSFHLDFSKGLLLPSKRVRFASQKDSFCWVKGLVLQCKRTPFGNPLDFKGKVKREK